MAKVAEGLAHWLSGYLDVGVSLGPDRDRVPALQAERDAEWNRIAAASFLSDGEKRRMLGLAAVEA